MSGYVSHGKRIFDFSAALIGLVLLSWLIIICFLLSTIDTRRSGMFLQKRIGRHGKEFTLYKLRTMKDRNFDSGAKREIHDSGITLQTDSRITKFGSLLRKSKVDELPQLFNVLIGDMSLVGPRPEMPEYLSLLKSIGADTLELYPGITGPASIQYRNEELLLASVDEPKMYNDTVVLPHKVELNRQYIDDCSFLIDINYILKTIGLKS